MAPGAAVVASALRIDAVSAASRFDAADACGTPTTAERA
jgi:hypothetical protein